jgi:hypothetical protein
MQTSPLWDEIRAQGRAEVEMETVLELGAERFGKPPTRKQRSDLIRIKYLDRLARIRRRLLTATS